MNKTDFYLKVRPITIILFVVTAMFASCSKNGNDDSSNVKVTGGQVDQTVYADDTQGQGKVTIKTAGAWTSTITETPVTKAENRAEATWVSISPDHGDAAGDYTISISLADNYTGSDRKATIAIICNDDKIDITIMQKGTDKDGEIPVSDAIVLNGVAWATRNVDKPGEFAASPQDRGGFYSFESSKTACPAGWRLPTKEEFGSLADVAYEYVDMGYGETEKNYAWFGSGDNRLLFMSTSQGQGEYLSGEETGPGTGNAFCLYFGSNFVHPDAALYGGNAVFSVRCVKKQTVTVPSPDGVMVNGVTWASRNVGESGKFVDNYWDMGKQYTFEEAQKACPAGWRTPTYLEQRRIMHNATEINSAIVNGIFGIWIGSGSNTFFLPQVDEGAMIVNTPGQYWSGSRNESNGMYFMFFNYIVRDGKIQNPVSGGIYDDNNIVAHVRCVKQ